MKKKNTEPIFNSNANFKNKTIHSDNSKYETYQNTRVED